MLLMVFIKQESRPKETPMNNLSYTSPGEAARIYRITVIMFLEKNI